MYSIGIDIGGTGIKTGLVAPDGTIEMQTVIPTVPEKGYALMVGEMTDEIKKILAAKQIDFYKLRGIGVGIPGIADSNSGIVRVAVNLNWRDVLLAAEFQKYYPLPVKLSNDANCAALGEQRFGSGKGHDNIVFITIGTGVGSGIVMNGQLVEGNGSAGGESGHMVIVIDGERCNCGRRGCWESYASATALISQTRAMMKRYPDSAMHRVAEAEGKVSGKTAFRAADLGDGPAKLVTEQYIKYVSTGLINLTNILHPEAFIIGGGVSHEGDNLIKPVENAVNDFIKTSGMYPNVAVRQASLGNNAGLLGASALV